MPSVIGFGLIFGFTGGALSSLPIEIVSSMSYIIFAGSAQFLVLILIIDGEPLIGLITAGILINLRHLLYGANLNSVLQVKSIKKILIAYLLTDEAFLITSLTKKSFDESPEMYDVYNLSDVLIGAGFTLWSTWNISTILGYIAAPIVQDILIFDSDFILSATFLGYLIIHWRENPQERIFVLLLIVISCFLAFFIVSSTLIITVLLFGIIYTFLLTSFKENKNRNYQSRTI